MAQLEPEPAVIGSIAESLLRIFLGVVAGGAIVGLCSLLAYAFGRWA